MVKDLLLEIGTEEIPAEFIPRALKDMSEIIAREFSQNRLHHGDIRTMATPRRLVLSVIDVAQCQEDRILEKIGPAKRVSFDEKGNPTKAALGFAKGQGIDISEVETIVNEKGEYICARKHIRGEDAKTVLPEILKRFILTIPFQKSMRWMDLNIRFVRPIHWIVALYGDEVLSFRLENIESGNTSYGHRFMSPKPFVVRGLDDYLQKAEKSFVIVDQDERKKRIRAEVEKTARSVSGFALENEDLLEEVTYLVEYPSTVCGTFDPKFLKIPKDVLVTTMMEHQKYFPVIDSDGKLLPFFITVNNTPAKDPNVVARGNERVLRARLSDAQFFFEEDQKVPLDKHFEDLKNVVFQSSLGTSYDKVIRFRELALYIADIVNPAVKKNVERAALLAKADLETKMVYEFPDLQGIMGREYALLAGEDPMVAKAIYEHHLPTSAGGKLPETDEGAIVGIADKMDTICGFFGINQIPTGTADPYALRRQALGIINIILEKGYPLSLDDLIEKSLSILNEKLKRSHKEIKNDVLDFFRGRFENQLIAQGRSYDVVDAVLATGLSDPARAVRKIVAMENLKARPDFEPLAAAFKRVCNIIKNFTGGKTDPTVFVEKEEETLYQAYLDVKENVEDHIRRDDYVEALLKLAGMRQNIDDFFETILVMAEDEKIRFNRLSLLEAISKLFYGIADFSRITTAI
jgi:glycyl-tRNA synthetase beta chain